MTEKDDKPQFKLKFAPGVLEGLEQEMSQEELQEFMDALKEAVDTGAIFEAQPVDLEQLERDEPEVYQALIAQLDLMGVEGDTVSSIVIPTSDRVLH